MNEGWQIRFARIPVPAEAREAAGGELNSKLSAFDQIPVHKETGEKSCVEYIASTRVVNHLDRLAREGDSLVMRNDASSFVPSFASDD